MTSIRYSLQVKVTLERRLLSPENTKAKLDATPGQSSDDWNQQVEMMQGKNNSMREALAKMWGVEEGHNPFKEGKQSNPDNFEPFKKKDSLFNGKYWKIIKDFNLNLMPSSLTINSDIILLFFKINS